MILNGVFKCQDCGAEETVLIQAPDKRMICADRAACSTMQILEGLKGLIE